LINIYSINISELNNKSILVNSEKISKINKEKLIKIIKKEKKKKEKKKKKKKKIYIVTIVKYRFTTALTLVGIQIEILDFKRKFKIDK
jgi:hypothetical protein